MNQLTLFSEAEVAEVLIPLDVVSPLESNKSIKSKAFKKQQQRWAGYVQSVQDSFGCSWFDARKLVIEHRDKQHPINIKLVEKG